MSYVVCTLVTNSSLYGYHCGKVGQILVLWTNLFEPAPELLCPYLVHSKIGSSFVGRDRKHFGIHAHRIPFLWSHCCRASRNGKLGEYACKNSDMFRFFVFVLPCLNFVLDVLVCLLSLKITSIEYKRTGKFASFHLTRKTVSMF